MRSASKPTAGVRVVPSPHPDPPPPAAGEGVFPGFSLSRASGGGSGWGWFNRAIASAILLGLTESLSKPARVHYFGATSLPATIFIPEDPDAEERALQEAEADLEAGRVVPHADVVRWLDDLAAGTRVVILRVRHGAQAPEESRSGGE